MYGHSRSVLLYILLSSNHSMARAFAFLRCYCDHNCIWNRLQNSPFLRQKSENRGFWSSFGARSWNGRTGRGRSRAPSLSPHFLFPLLARLLPRPVLPFHDRAPKLDFRISGEKKPGLFCSLYLKHKSLMVIHFPSGTPAVFWAWTHERTILIMLKYV